MSEPIIIPEHVRADLLELNRVAQQAQRDVQVAMATACRFLGLDPNGRHSVDLATGIVTPEVKTPASEPTPIRAEA